MATVYRAIQTSLNRVVALKILSAQQAAADPQFSVRFRREAESIAKLRHQNILNIIDYGQMDKMAYIVMEYLAGGSLRELLDRPLPVEYAVSIAAQVADALDVAHSQGIVHRDIKPANILLEDRGSRFDPQAGRERPPWVVLADFGIARMMTGGTTLTQAGTGIGTPEYMSPEQAQGKKDVDGRCDIYALGIVLFEMLTGRLPFTGTAPLSIALAQVQKPLPQPRSINPAIPVPVENVILKATAKRREDRYATAGEMSKALYAALAAPVQQAKPTSQPTIRSARETAKPASRRLSTPLIVGAAALVLLCVLAGVFLLFLR